MNRAEGKERSHCIDVRMIPSKCAYFFQDGTGGCYVAFITVFLTSLGLDVKEAGFISGIRLISSSIAGPIWGYLTDHTGRRKLIFIILCIGYVLTTFPMPWIGRAFQESPTNSSNFNNHGNIGNQSMLLNHTSITGYSHLLRADTSKDNLIGTHKTFSSRLFYVMLAIVFISNIFSNPIIGVIDSFVMNVVKSSTTPTAYGNQRLLGAIGYGVFSFVAGVAADSYHHATLSKYTAIFFVFLPIILCLLPTGLIVASQTKWEKNQIDPDKKVNKLKLLIKTFSDFDNTFFMLSALITGIAQAVMASYLFMLMDDKMNGTKTAMGLSNTIAGLAELLVLPFSNRLLKFFRGPIPCVEIAIFSYFVRLLLLSYIENQWLVLPTCLLNCFSFALFWVGAAEQTEIIAPKEIYVTMFSILSSVYFNVGGVFGYMVGGVIYSNYSGSILFQGTAYLCGIWFILMVLHFHVIGRIKNDIIELPPDEDTPLLDSI